VGDEQGLEAGLELVLDMLLVLAGGWQSKE
jgi:hypothetical protein